MLCRIGRTAKAAFPHAAVHDPTTEKRVARVISAHALTEIGYHQRSRHCHHAARGEVSLIC